MPGFWRWGGVAAVVAGWGLHGTAAPPAPVLTLPALPAPKPPAAPAFLPAAAAPVAPAMPPEPASLVPATLPRQAAVSATVPATLPESVPSPAAPSPAAPAPVVTDVTPPNWLTDAPHAAGGEAHAHPPGNLTPSAPPDGGFFMSAEYLVLRARRGAFDYVVADPNRDLATDGKLQSLGYELRSGVRAAVGYRLPDCGWEVLGGYTYYRTSAGAFSAAGAGGSLYPTLTRPGLVDEVSTARALANLELNLYDAEVGRRFVVDDHLALRMSGGVRFASIRQTLSAQYDGIDARSAVVENRSNFDGFGPTVGAEAVWAGGRGFHLYAKATGGLLTGQARNPLTETNNGGLTRYANLDASVRKVVPVAGLGIGGGWQYRRVSLRVGYEITNFFGLIDQPRFADDVSRGKVITRPADLSLEGLFTQVGYSF